MHDDNDNVKRTCSRDSEEGFRCGRGCIEEIIGRYNPFYLLFLSLSFSFCFSLLSLTPYSAPLLLPFAEVLHS